MVDGPSPIVLLTGLSGAGKTSIGQGVHQRLQAAGVRSELLDGDDLRATLCRDLGFSREDRHEHFTRIAWISELLARHGVVVLIAAIAPIRAQRDAFRTMHPHVREVYVKAPLQVCEARDPKGLYAASRVGTLTSFTGVDSPYEEPIQPDLVCHTSIERLTESVAKVLELITRCETTM